MKKITLFLTALCVVMMTLGFMINEPAHGEEAEETKIKPPKMPEYCLGGVCGSYNEAREKNENN